MGWTAPTSLVSSSNLAFFSASCRAVEAAPPELESRFSPLCCGDPMKQRLRSRLVCRDIKARELSAGSDLFSATPPLEAVQALVSVMT
eukprot:3954576-Amphidinium_carterae.1